MVIKSDDYSEIRLSKFPKTISLLTLFISLFLSLFSFLLIFVVITLLILFIICNSYYKRHKLFFSNGYLYFLTYEKFAVRVSDIETVEYKRAFSLGPFFKLVNISVKTIKGNTYVFGPVDDTVNLRTYIQKQIEIHRDVTVDESQKKEGFRDDQASSKKTPPKSLSELSEEEAKRIFERIQNSSGVMLENMVTNKIMCSSNIHDVLLLRNLYVPKRYSDTYTEVDLVMIHDTGVYVFECKNYSGRVYGYANAQNWRVYYSNGDNHCLLNPILQNHSHITALSRFLNIDESYFKSWIVFNNKSGSKLPDSCPEYVICDCNELNALLSYVLPRSKLLLSSDEKNRIYQQLTRCTQVSYKERLQHISRIHSKYGRY